MAAVSQLEPRLRTIEAGPLDMSASFPVKGKEP